jgi:outer membrane protein assembly factor BamB
VTTTRALVALDARSGSVRWSQPESADANRTLLGASNTRAYVETLPDSGRGGFLGDVSCGSGRAGHLRLAARGIGAVGEGRIVLAGALNGQRHGSDKVFVVDERTGRVHSTTPFNLRGDAAGVGRVLISAGRIFVSGTFDHAASQPRDGLAALSLATGAVLPWRVAPWTFGYPMPLASDGLRLLLGTSGEASALAH